MIRAEWTNNDALSTEQTTQTNLMVEPRYIKATDVISILSLFYNYTDVERYDLALAISAVPTADVVEVKHGKWIMHIDDLFPAESTMECSECHHEQSLIIDDNFCPNCGAEMRKEKV